MLKQKLHHFFKNLIGKLQTYTDKIWYMPFIGFLAAIDNLILIVPTDGLLISSTMLKPRRWINYALIITIGSALGAIALAGLVEILGLPWIESTYPQIVSSKSWLLTKDFFEQYGLIVVFIVSAGPVMQHPAIVLAALADTDLKSLTFVLFFGRLLKFLILAYISSHAPRLLSRLWGIQSELEEVGINKTE